MASIFQPGDDQTFLFKSYPSGQQYECHLTAHEILQIAKTIDPTFDSVALLAYASSTFGYWIFPFTLGSPSTVNFRDIGVLPSGYDGNYIAIDKDVSSYNIAYIISDDGTTLDGRLGTNGWDTIYVSELSSNYWFKVFSNDNYPNVLYTESNYGKLYINGSEYNPPIATIRVNYYLPDDNYEYAKITYKKNDKPESVNDGTIVPISPNDSYIDIPKFVEGQSYWFKIFTNKSESEAFPYTVGPITDPVPPEYKQYIEIINGSGFNFKNYSIQYGTNVLQPIIPTVISQMSWVVSKNYARWDKIYPSTPITVKLTGDTTHITVTYEGYSNSEYTKCNDSYRIMYNDKSYDSQDPENVLLGDNIFTAYYGMNYYSVGNFTTEFAINNADNIQKALIFFTTRFKNIIIYVNDELWSNPFN